MSSIVVEEALRTMALKNIKRFYIEYFSKNFNVELTHAASMLYEFSKESNRLTIKYEIRCSNCINILDELDDISEIKQYTEIECDDCGHYNHIDFNNIYMVYYISDEYRKEILELSKQHFPSRLSRRSRNRSTLSTPSISIGTLEKIDALDLSEKDGKISVCYNYYNYGNVGAMGHDSEAKDFEMNNYEKGS